MPAEEAEGKQKKTDAADAAAAPKDAKKAGMSPLMRKLVLAGVVAGIIGVEAVVAYMLVQATKQEDPHALAAKKEKEQEEASHSKQTAMGLTTEPIGVVVNIGSGEDERYAKVSIQLEFDDIKYPLLMEGLKLRTPKIKNILIESLSSMSVQDLTTPVGKVKLRQTVLREVNRILPKDEGTVRDVFLSEFILQ